MLDYLILAIALVPAGLLTGWAIWVAMHELPAADFNDFLEHEDFWGRQ